MRAIPWAVGLLILAATLTAGCRSKKAPEAPAGPAPSATQPEETAASPQPAAGGWAEGGATPTPGEKARAGVQPQAAPQAGTAQAGVDGQPIQLPSTRDPLSRKYTCASGAPARTVRTLQLLSEIQRSQPQPANPRPLAKKPDPSTLAAPGTPVAPN